MPAIDVNDGSINYRLDGPGDAPVLVLSSSLGVDTTMWEPQIPALVQRFRVLRYDHRGHGGSRATPGPYTIEQLARDVLGLLDGLGIDRAHFCGLSMGGMVGQWLGAHAPERLHRLVLASTAPYIGPAEIWNTRIEAVREGGMAAITEAVLGRWFTAPFLERAPAAVEPVRRALLATPPEGYVACCAAVRDMDQRESVAGVVVPTLVLAGTRDPVTPPAEGRFLAGRIPGAEYVELDAAHLSNIEAAERFNDAVLGFLVR